MNKRFPCEKYEHIDAFDSFVTHQNRNKDLEKQQKIGVEIAFYVNGIEGHFPLYSKAKRVKIKTDKIDRRWTAKECFTYDERTD